MFCNQCGKDNPENTGACRYCGSPMPAASGCGGFADILSFEAKNMEITIEPDKTTNQEGISEYDMQKLLKKTDEILKTNRQNRLFQLITVLLCGLILIFTLVFGVSTMNAVKLHHPKVVQGASGNAEADNTTTPKTETTTPQSITDKVTQGVEAYKATPDPVQVTDNN